MMKELLSLGELEEPDYAKISWGLGIHTAGNSNISLIDKHVRDILLQPRKLWVQMSRHKYLSDTHILHTHFKPGDSCIWRVVVKAVEILGTCFIRDTNFRLCDLLEIGDWNFNKIYSQLPSFYQDCILSITIDHDNEDRLIWIAYPNGQFSGSYGYR